MGKQIIIQKLTYDLYYINTSDISSNLASIGYCTTTKTMFVKFKSNMDYVYWYEDIEPMTFIDMLASESLGKYFCKNIKDRYQCVKVDMITKEITNIKPINYKS